MVIFCTLFFVVSVCYLILKKPVETWWKRRKEDNEKRAKLLKEKYGQLKDLEEIRVGDKEGKEEDIEGGNIDAKLEIEKRVYKDKETKETSYKAKPEVNQVKIEKKPESPCL